MNKATTRAIFAFGLMFWTLAASYSTYHGTGSNIASASDSTFHWNLREEAFKFQPPDRQVIAKIEGEIPLTTIAKWDALEVTQADRALAMVVGHQRTK